MTKAKRLLDYFINYVKSIDHIWLKTWLLIYVGFLFLDAFSHIRYGDATIIQDWILFGRTYKVPVIYNGTFIGTTLLKYIGILLNFIYAHKKFPNDHLLQIALGFTLLADTILCLNSTSVYGVLVFCIAQYFHTARLADVSSRNFIVYTLLILCALILGHFMGVPPIFTIGFVYASALVTNLLLSLQWFKTAKLKMKQKLKSEPGSKAIRRLSPDRSLISSTCAFFGFVLFLSCDLLVATSFFALVGFFPFFLYAPANYFCWVFYYVSQLLIANSSTNPEVDKNSKIDKNSDASKSPEIAKNSKIFAQK